MSNDRLSPQSPTWTRPIREPSADPRDVARWWREVSAVEPDPVKADDYLRLADALDKFIALHNGEGRGY